MRFLDPKEEVVKIKITPYGKYLLSMGKFNPTYYAFFDDDIIYDLRYTAHAGDELQNDIEDRVLNETPRFEGQTKFEGSEATVFVKNQDILEELFPGIGGKADDPSYNINILESPINQYFLQSPLGTSGYNSNKAPYYSLEMITGSIFSASIAGVSGSGYFNYKSGSAEFIPQVDIEIMNEIILHKGGTRFDEMKLKKLQDDEMFDSYHVFSKDSSFLEYDKKRAFIKLEEGNTEFKKENFDVEVFEIITQKVMKDGEEVPKVNLKKLSFTKEDDETNSMNIEYFFNLKFDNEIDDSYYCEALRNKKNKIKNIFSDKTFKCPDKQEDLVNVDIYNNETTGDK
tara:strand:+ start:1265 stop:2290 length:1026 start_codon:yes stop_codon:yes gene_type:complete